MSDRTICAAGGCEWCGCTFRRPSDVMYHRCAAMQEQAMPGGSSWRDAIASAASAVPDAYLRRRHVFQAAHVAGMSLRQIGEASGLSTNAVSKIVGPVGRRRGDLDAPLGESLPSPDAARRTEGT